MKTLKAKIILCILMVSFFWFCLFDLMLYVPSTIFQLNRDSLPGLNQYWARINVSCSRTTTQWRRWGSNSGPLGLEPSTLPQRHCAPYLMGSSTWYDAIDLGWFVVYFEGSQGIIFDWMISLSKQCRPWWNAALCDISSGVFPVCQSTGLGVPSIQRVKDTHTFVMHKS